MANNGNNKLKLLWIYKILLEETDESHGVTTDELIQLLQAQHISSERKSIYRDIKRLEEFGADIAKIPHKPVEYALVNRLFTLDQLMLMVDAIQSCCAISQNQANELVSKVEELASKNQKGLLHKRIRVAGRVKQQTESVFSNVDEIYKSINEKCKLTFTYQRVGADGRFHKDTAKTTHTVSPIGELGISYENGFYYLSAYDEKYQEQREFRIDRMTNIHVLHDERATYEYQISETEHTDFNDPQAPVAFGRFRGKMYTVTLESDADKAGIMVDRFGDKVHFLAPQNNCARAFVKIYESEQFFGWLAGMGNTVRLVKPEPVIADYKKFLQKLLDQLSE